MRLDTRRLGLGGARCPRLLPPETQLQALAGGITAAQLGPSPVTGQCPAALLSGVTERAGVRGHKWAGSGRGGGRSREPGHGASCVFTPRVCRRVGEDGGRPLRLQRAQARLALPSNACSRGSGVLGPAGPLTLSDKLEAARTPVGLCAWFPSQVPLSPPPGRESLGGAPQGASELSQALSWLGAGRPVPFLLL